MPSLILSEAQRAAILAGAPMIEVPGPSPASAPASPETPQAPAQGAPAASASAAPAAPAGETVPAPAASADAVKVLAEQLSASQAKVGELTAALSAATAKATEAQAALPDLYQIVRASVGTLQVALGASDTSKAVADGSLVGEHKRLLEAFQAKFPASRVSASIEEGGPAGQTVHPAFLARLEAVAGSRK